MTLQRSLPSLAPLPSLHAKIPIPRKWICIGDSLVYGFGDAEGGGWVERLRRQWLTPEYPDHVLYNLGVRGDTVQHVAQRLAHEFQGRGELRNRVPDYLVLSVGVNDSARLGHRQGRHFTPFPEFQDALAQLLDQAQRLCPTLFIGMVPVNEAQMPFLGSLHYTHADQHLYKEATRLACQERQIPYLDLFEHWQRRGLGWCRERLCTDGLHPNAQGHAAILTDLCHWPPFQNWMA